MVITYKSIWTPFIGEVLRVEVEVSNREDQYAVAILKDNNTVGHVPHELSRTLYFFLRRGGSIECSITGHRKFGIGPEVPCTYKVYGEEKYVNRLVTLLTDEKRLVNLPTKIPDE